jgi:ABC-2 type transport system permease protein
MALLALLRSAMRAFGNSGRLVRSQSRLKVLVVLSSMFFLFAGLGAIFYQGFHFLHTLGGAGLMVIHRLFSLFFFGLSIMLVFSSVATSYTTMYRSDDVPSLLVRPVPMGELALYKFLESALFSSWAFFFMILPFIGAYALHERLSPFFAIWTLLFSVPFVVLCSAVGSIFCMLLVRWLPGGRALFILLGGLALVGLALIGRMALAGPPAQDDAGLILTRLIPGMRASSHPMLPSWWISEGIMALARGAWGRGAMLWLLMVSTVLAFGVAIEWLGRRIFYEGWLKGAGTARRALQANAEMPWIERLFAFGDPATRALVLKDIRSFVRDPAQWSQMVVFFGLLAIYFVNLRQLRYHLLPPEWRNLIVFLNMFSVSAVICSLSSRFVYPQMSLEGHSFWVLGLSPLTMDSVVRSKFRLSAGLLVFVSLGLMWLSTAMLKVDPILQLVAVLSACCICVVVTALAVGLGSVFVDVKQRNPAAIVSSFGGTLNLVLSMAFTFAVLIPLAAIFHGFAMGHLSATMFHRFLVVSIAAMLALTWVCAAVPLSMGVRSLQSRDF